jgi:hypothetical protein
MADERLTLLAAVLSIAGSLDLSAMCKILQKQNLGKSRSCKHTESILALI